MAAKLDLAIDGGADWQRDLIWQHPDTTPYDLSGYTAKMQIRASQPSTTFLVELTTENGKILLQPDATPGLIRLVLDEADTGSLPKSAVYDLDLIDGTGFTRRLLQGKVRTSLAVTR